MAPASTRSSTNTDLFIGSLKASIGLFGTNAKPAGLPSDWQTAGPNGGRLKFEQRGQAAPAAAQGEADAAPAPNSIDPLGPESLAAAFAEPAKESKPADPDLLRQMAAAAPAPGALVEGEFRRVLVEEGSGEVVEADDVRRGIRLESGAFIDCTDQLAAIEARTALENIQVVACIDSTQIRRQRVLAAYYIGAQDPKSAPALRAFYEALKQRREVAVVKYTTRKRQQLGVIEADGKTGTLMLLQLVWAQDWREAPAKAKAVSAAQVTSGQINLMGQLLGTMHDTVGVLDTLQDEAITLREELLTRAQAGEMTQVVEPLKPEADDVDLMAQLERALEPVA